MWSSSSPVWTGLCPRSLPAWWMHQWCGPAPHPPPTPLPPPPPVGDRTAHPFVGAFPGISLHAFLAREHAGKYTGSPRTDAFYSQRSRRAHIVFQLLCEEKGSVGTSQIAVPTSVGYGAAFSGISPLLSALTAGAPGVATVNIDNGFGAAMLVTPLTVIPLSLMLSASGCHLNERHSIACPRDC